MHPILLSQRGVRMTKESSCCKRLLPRQYFLYDIITLTTHVKYLNWPGSYGIYWQLPPPYNTLIELAERDPPLTSTKYVTSLALELFCVLWELTARNIVSQPPRVTLNPELVRGHRGSHLLPSTKSRKSSWPTLQFQTNKGYIVWYCLETPIMWL